MEKDRSQDSLVDFVSVSHRYRRDWAIRDVSFSIDRTGIYGLIGRNGAGKSTLMKILCGAMYPTSGNVTIEGLNTRADRISANKRLGYLPQRVPLYKTLTVDEYLSYCAHLKRMPRKRVAHAVRVVKDRCQVAHFGKRLMGSLSGGYQRRVGIAQAVINAPSLVVLDEPSSGLDPEQSLEMRALLKDIGEQCAVLISTHILEDIQELCRGIVLLADGRIAFRGSLDEFVDTGRVTKITFTSDSVLSVQEQLKEMGNVRQVHLDRNRFELEVDERVEEVILAILRHSASLNSGVRDLQIDRSTVRDAYLRAQAAASDRDTPKACGKRC